MTAICCYVASMCYFLMARNSGWVAIEVEFVREGQMDIAQCQPNRQVFWIRYVSWYVIVGPLELNYTYLEIPKAVHDSNTDD